MTPIELNIPAIDWPLLRQALSLSLLRSRPVAVRGGASFLDGLPGYAPLFDDLSSTLAAMRAGSLIRDGECIIYEPGRILPGTYCVESGPFSSAMEIMLLLMPALFHGDFRTILKLRGVTHSVLSYPTAFIKETLMARLERMGFYAALTLRRFGFHGSGGGSAEARVYPREKPGPSAPDPGASGVQGAKIFIARLDRELALREKHALAGGLGIAEDSVAIIEVIDADGYGNSIQVFARCGGAAHVFFRDMNFFSADGSIEFSEEDFRRELDGLADEVLKATKEGILPAHVSRELYPYVILSGALPGPENDGPGLDGIRYLCGKLL